MREQEIEVSNGLRVAVLVTAMARANPGHAREVVGSVTQTLKAPKATYFLAVLLIDSVKRISVPPTENRRRLIHNRDFPDVLDYNRIVARADGRSEALVDEWAEFARKNNKMSEGANPAKESNEREQGESHERKKHKHRT